MSIASSRTPSFTSRRPRRAGLTSLLLLTTLLGVGACGDDDVTVPETATSVDVTPRLSSVTAGQTVQLTAQAKNASGGDIANGDLVWTSLDTNVARVSSSGLVTVLASGATAVTARTRGATGFASIEGIGVISTVVVDGSNALPVQQTTQLTAAPLEANGRQLFAPVTWASSLPAVATVSSTGVVTTLSVGTTNITATAGGKTGTLVFTVLPPPPVATVTFTPNTGFLPTGVGVPLSVTLADANGGTLIDRVITYSSSDNAIATVSASGVVTAQAPGVVTITVTSEGQSASAEFDALTGLQSATARTFGNTVGNSTFYAVYVPAGTTLLNVILRGGTGDPDLYVYSPAANGTALLCASENGGANVVEDCNINNPTAGVHLVEVFAFSTHVGTAITATITP